MSNDSSGSPFTHRPKPEDMPNQWKILRAEARGTPRVLCLSEDTIGAYVHYWKGRTSLCLKDCCEACDLGQAPRWRGYVACVVANVGTKRLLELTPPCVPVIERLLKERGTLRGVVLQIKRKGGKPNGELELVASEEPSRVGDLPSCPDVSQHLLRIWKATHAPLPSERASDASAATQRGFGEELLQRRSLIPLASQNGRGKPV